MKSLVEYLKEEMDKSIYIDTLYVDSSLAIEPEKQSLLIEAKTLQVGKTKYWYRIDKPFGEPRPGNQEHMHGFIRKKKSFRDIFAANKDGSAHDGWHNTSIPTDFNPILNANGFRIPKGNLIEMVLQPAQNDKLLLESKSSEIEFSLSKFEITNIAIKVGYVLHNASHIIFGITNKPLFEISEERVAEGFTFKVIKLLPTRESAELLVRICTKVAEEIGPKDVSCDRDISEHSSSAAYVFYVAYVK